VSSVSTVSSVSAPEKLTSFSVERELSDAEIEEIKRILGKQKKPVTNDELAALAGVSKAEMSKRVSKCVNAGIIEKLKAGKFAQISLVA
jgi:predicted transcriptional regulator